MLARPQRWASAARPGWDAAPRQKTVLSWETWATRRAVPEWPFAGRTNPIGRRPNTTPGRPPQCRDARLSKQAQFQVTVRPAGQMAHNQSTVATLGRPENWRG